MALLFCFVCEIELLYRNRGSDNNMAIVISSTLTASLLLTVIPTQPGLFFYFQQVFDGWSCEGLVVRASTMGL